MKEEQFHIQNKQEMINLAKDLAKDAKQGDIFGLVGTLGAGKSFFAAAFINALSKEKIDVTSPTFNLLNVYEMNQGPDIYHFDLYRLEDEEELFNLGIEDALIEGITLIEWPQIAQSFLSKNYIQLDIKIKDEESRVITVFRS
jgi:tRNA threonylcarbamoyl adenosine modification protein YjeE